MMNTGIADYGLMIQTYMFDVSIRFLFNFSSPYHSLSLLPTHIYVYKNFFFGSHHDFCLRCFDFDHSSLEQQCWWLRWLDTQRFKGKFKKLKPTSSFYIPHSFLHSLRLSNGYFGLTWHDKLEPFLPGQQLVSC